jgi:hypothetical protein
LADDEDDATPCDADSNASSSNAFFDSNVRTYNAADDAPAPRAVALAFAAALLAGQKTLNVTVESEAEAEAEARVVNDRGEKRVSNERAKTELGVFFAFPTYKEGLTAIADGDTSPFSEKTLDLL